ncbi:lytic transglycosylase domain-containing protein [Sulfitobacter albidus]|uniref:Lytic transglycosylase domain-containing protein n=1 Tax=Sulfitobacter albidus TaxID=2829501 RepID=A0A975JES3_9RHOB|nr:lytic transglycosylase domain-containing protein [Sulfitobacter albidus]QUJ77167.1 lytic transglycosylase domain-containing protein [Sulfitobacter albidus]
MRLILALTAALWATTAAAEPPQRACSTGKWGHAHCIRPAHFVYDTCNAIKVFSDRHGLNTDFFARLIWQESRFDPNALSPANARGIAQFIPSTARLRGLKDPYNPADALEHSAQYLAEMVRRYGNEGMAAIGYNGGERRAEGFLEGKGLARETVNYVPIITGLSAEQWRDAPPKDLDMRLDKTKPFIEACREMAKNRRLTPVKLPKPPPPAIKPWGVQLGFGTSKDAAKAKIGRATGACRAPLNREKLDLIFVKNRVSGKNGYYFGRVGRDTRRGAMRLCDELKRRGCRCLVVQNK